MNKPHVIRNVLSQEERISLWDYFDRRSQSMNSLATWTFNNASYGQGDPVSWQHPLRTDLIFTKCATTVRLKIMKFLRRDIKLCKIHANGQTAGQNTMFHKDWEEHNVWTFIYFNQPHWDQEWGGEFVCQTPDDEYHHTPYVPNTGALIPSNWLHKGQPPNTLIGNEIRTTIAFSFCDPEIHDKIIAQNTRKWY